MIVNNDFENKQWKDIQVGDILQLSNDQFIPVRIFFKEKKMNYLD